MQWHNHRAHSTSEVQRWPLQASVHIEYFFLTAKHGFLFLEYFMNTENNQTGPYFLISKAKVLPAPSYEGMGRNKDFNIHRELMLFHDRFCFISWLHVIVECGRYTRMKPKRNFTCSVYTKFFFTNFDSGLTEFIWLIQRMQNLQYRHHNMFLS